MSDLYAPPDQQSGPAPAHEPSPEIPMWLILGAVGLLVVLAVGGGVALLRAQKPPPGPSYPDHWDSRIAPFAKIAEQKRGLLFEHPVTVKFLPAAAFEKTVKTDDSKLDSNDRKELKQFAGLMRAFGLIKGDVNLLQASNEASGAGTLAYYSYDDKTITIRGKKLTPAVRLTLVHELTHVLQDQHFDIGARTKQLQKDESKDGSSTNESSVFDALVEGDAERVAALYQKSLGAKQRKATDAGRHDEVSKANKRLKKVPKVVTTLMMSPYALGQGMVEAVAANGGNAAVDQMFRDTPRHETALFDPFLVLAGHTGAAKVAAPSLGKGEKKFDNGELGVLTWYFMLAERMPLRDALAAADGWGGDNYVAFERDGNACVRMNYTGRTGGDTTRMLSALRRWVAAAPGSPARVSRHGDVLRFQSCDPGKAADVGKDASGNALSLLTLRTDVGTTVLRSGAPDRTARCYAGKLVQAFTLPQLTTPRLLQTHPAAMARARRIGLACR